MAWCLVKHRDKFSFILPSREDLSISERIIIKMGIREITYET
jgi:hypothetical protein